MSTPAESKPESEPRLERADRRQMTWEAQDLDGLIPIDHRARLVWEYVEEQDLSLFHVSIKAVEGHSGRPAIDPAILLALWLYATLEGVGSARALDRLCGEHNAYRWLCGGVGVNYHTLADFRVRHTNKLDRLLTVGVAALLKEGLVELDRVAQDGMKVRASAGTGSFRTPKSLEECLVQAQAQVRKLRAEVDADPAASSRRQEAAKQRAARERRERVKKAIAAAKEVERARQKGEGRSKEEGRGSTTDSDARVMKMGDGGFRPALNAQLATDTKTQVIVGVDVTNRGSDFGELVPMADQLKSRYRVVPKEWLADGGYASHDNISEMAERGCRVYAPPSKSKKRNRYRARPGEDPVIGRWRRRMGSESGKRVYRGRAATAECVNALARMRGLRQFVVRGLEKARAVLLWFALAHNLMRGRALRTA
jgi:transposase